MMKVILMHGKHADPTQKWYPWLASEKGKRGIEFIAPALPHTDEPVFEEWLSEIDKCNPDQDTIMVGHSRGGVAVLRWLERQPENIKVKKVILVATNGGKIEGSKIAQKSNPGFYTDRGYDFERIKSHWDSFVVLHSNDDNVVPFSAGVENAKGLNAKILEFTDRGHFGDNINSISELLEALQ